MQRAQVDRIKAETRGVPLTSRVGSERPHVEASRNHEPQGVQGLPETWRGKRSKWENRTVYVPLVLDADRMHWKAEKVTAVKPAAGPFLKGHMRRYGALEFGIEAYYVQEGAGRVYEQAIRDRKLSAELAVTSSGQAALRALRIE